MEAIELLVGAVVTLSVQGSIAYPHNLVLDNLFTMLYEQHYSTEFEKEENFLTYCVDLFTVYLKNNPNIGINAIKRRIDVAIQLLDEKHQKEQSVEDLLAFLDMSKLDSEDGETDNND